MIYLYNRFVITFFYPYHWGSINSDTAIVKNNGNFNKFMWVVDDDWNYENWVFVGNLNEE